MGNMLVAELMENVGSKIVFWRNNLRFEGKILEVDSEYLKYYDTHKDKERFIRIEYIENMEITK
jgi:hypothetical protein